MHEWALGGFARVFTPPQAEKLTLQVYRPGKTKTYNM